MNVFIPNAPTRSFAARMVRVLSAFCKEPSQVATIVPSSRQLIDAIAVRDCVRDAGTVVELGPGAGGTTEGLLGCMKPESTLLAIEKTTVFEAALAEIHDPRLRVTIADATDLMSILKEHSLPSVDVVVSGIPFSSLPPLTAKRIMQSIYESLQPGGTLIAYQWRGDVKDYARPLFGPPISEKIFWNLPPLSVHAWTKVVPSGDDS